MEGSKKVKRNRIKIGILSVLAAIGCFILIAYARTWGKTELEFKIHINDQLVLQSVFGESPTFAIWIENTETRENKTIFVTKRAGTEDWEGKVNVPSALPRWGEINEIEQQTGKAHEDIDAVSGATPQPGYFITRARMKPGSRWICWIEMNLAGDYNENYPEYDEEKKTSDEYGTGQPALVYKAYVEAQKGNVVIPEVIGMSIVDETGGGIIRPLEGITTALDVFDEIVISVVKPKPKVLEKPDFLKNILANLNP